MQPLRRRLAVDLMHAYGLTERDGVEAVVSEPAPDALIERVHAPAYVAAVRRYSESPAMAAAWEAGQWGLAAGGDTPAFAGMHDAAAAVCGASAAAALAIWEGRADQAFFAGGGLHHALANRASGFCVYNDTAVAIQALLDAGAERVAYIDIDVHHGDGTQWIFFEEPRVLTCSVHETGRYLFPGTGGMAERGIGAAEGTSVNVPAAALLGRPALPAGDRGGDRAGGGGVRARRDRDPGRRRPPPRRPAGPPAGHDAGLPAGLPLPPPARARGGRRPLGGARGRRLHLRGRAARLDAAVRGDARRRAGRTRSPRAGGGAAEELVGRAAAAPPVGDPEPEVPAEERARADVEGDRVVDDARALFLG